MVSRLQLLGVSGDIAQFARSMTKPEVAGASSKTLLRNHKCETGDSSPRPYSVSFLIRPREGSRKTDLALDPTTSLSFWDKDFHREG